MPYGNLYTAGFSSMRGTTKGILYIDKLDYAGGTTALKINQLKITHDFQDWNTHVIGIICEFTIVNNLSSFFTLLPLMTPIDGEYRVRVITSSPSTVNLFTGYLNCEAVSQKYLGKQELNLVASCYFGKLEIQPPPSIETLQYMSFIDIIDDILTMSNIFFNIRVNCKIAYKKSGGYASDDTLFNVLGFWTELFWEDNVKRTPAIEILEAVLSTFNCYLHWWDGYWYIDRYEEMKIATGNYVEYTAGAIYDSSTDGGTVVPVTKIYTDIQSFKFLEQSQTLSGQPGMRTIQINFNDKKLLNLINADMTGISSISPEYYNGYWTYPMQYRTWRFLTGTATYSDAGKSWKSIANSIKRTGTLPYNRAILTRFILNSFADAVMNITFKFAIPVTLINTAGGILWEDNNFKFYYKIGLYNGYQYLYKNPTTGVWTIEWADSGKTINEVIINGSNFDSATGVSEVSISVPIGEAGVTASTPVFLYLYNDQVAWKQNAYVDIQTAWYGDFKITINGELENNEIIGKSNTNFLAKKEVAMLFWDLYNFNYKNCIFTDFATDWPLPTMTYGTNQERGYWHINDPYYGAGVNSIQNLKLIMLFRLYNQSRQKLSGDVLKTSFLEPFQLYYDSAQANKQFVLGGYVYDVLGDRYVCDFYEYDNLTTINLV